MKMQEFVDEERNETRSKGKLGISKGHKQLVGAKQSQGEQGTLEFFTIID